VSPSGRAGFVRDAEKRLGMREMYRGMTTLFGVAAIVIGIAIVVQTARHGAGVGYVIGILFVVLGAGRLYLLRRR
jgi:uncharacterized membrane protein HdeD (DUF308 family)